MRSRPASAADEASQPASAPSRAGGCGLAGLAFLAGAAAFAQGPNLLSNPGFESGLAPWLGVGCTVELVSGDPFEGAASGRAVSRSEWWAGPRHALAGPPASGTVLLIEGAMRNDGPSPDDHQVKIRIDDPQAGSSSFLAARRTGVQGQWRTLRGIWPLGDVPAGSDVSLLLQSRSGSEAFSLDGFTVSAFEEDSQWRQLADAGIQAHRVRDAEVRIVTADGVTVAGVAQVRQVRHRFAFGATLFAPTLEEGNAQYESMFEQFFQWATPRNALKWKQTEQNRDQLAWSRSDLVVDYCRARGIPIYGHNIFWGVDDKVPDWVPGLNDTQLLAEMTERLDDLLGRYADDIDHWDVNNEMLHGSFFRDRLGAGIRPWMFEQALVRDPGARLFLNDYSVVGGGINGGEAESYVDHALDLLAAGAPIHGIGAQCHFADRPIIARWIRDRLDVLATAGLPLRLTEFDLVRADVNQRADDLEKFFRVAYSHPAVDGITLWGWWAGNHGAGPDAAIVDADFTINAAGRRYLDLLDEWTTSFDRSTGRLGRVDFGGHHGTYEVTIIAPGLDARPMTFELEPGAGTQPVELIAIGDCTGDVSADGASDFFDPLAYLRLRDAGDARTDLNNSGGPDVTDLILHMGAVGAGCG